jgi:hypothetical protein
MQGNCFIQTLPSAPLDSTKSVHFGGFGQRLERIRRLGRCYGTEFTEKENPMEHPATKKRGADPEVRTSVRSKADEAMERKLEQGLEESMAGSDPISITQPPKSKVDKQQDDKQRSN